MNKRVGIFGMTLNGFLLAADYLDRGYEVDLYDNSPKKQGQKFVRDILCKKPNEVCRDDICVIAVTQKDNIESIKNQLIGYGCTNIVVPTKEDIHRIKISINDEDYVKCFWLSSMDYKLDLDNPKTICEKLQWLKLYYRKPEFSILVDKYEVKKYLGDLIGEEYIIPLLGVWDSVDEIDLDLLPEQFVLKCNHNSGSYAICRDKKTFDFDAAKAVLSEGINENYFYSCREYPYKNVIPKIIAEKYIDSLGNDESVEYKVTCFNGKVDFVTFCKGPAHQSFDVRFNDHYDVNFRKMPWYTAYKPSGIDYKKPEQWDEMIRISEIIAKDIPYLRVDFYIVDNRLYFGEATFYTWAGFMDFQPKEWDLILGEKIVLPNKCIE